MKNMDKGLTVSKWVLINWPKIPQMPPNFLAQFVCPSPKVWDFQKKSSLWVSVLTSLQVFKSKNKDSRDNFQAKFDHSSHSDLLKTTQTQRSYCFRELWDGLTKKKQKKCLLTQQIGLVPVEEVQWKPQGSSFYQSIVFHRNKVKKWTPQCSPIFLWQTLIWHPTLLSKIGFSAISNYNSYFPSIFGIPYSREF